MKDMKTTTIKKPTIETSFIYYADKGRFSICDVDQCSKSSRTIDMSFFDLANNRELLEKIGLYYILGNYGVTYTHKSRGKWFAGYLSAFYPDSKGQYEKSVANPQIRLLIEDEKLMGEVKKCLLS